MATGFRQQPQASAKDKFRSVDVELKNLQMASRITQMMCQRLMESNKNMGEDLAKSFQIINELQYKVLAMQSVAQLDETKVNSLISELRLKDFNEASDKQDIADGFTVIDSVEEDSTVILTSTTPGTDAGIFRSRIKLSESGVEDLIKGFAGKGVGTQVTAKLNGLEHTVELLGIRRPKAQPVEATETLKVVE